MDSEGVSSGERRTESNIYDSTLLWGARFFSPLLLGVLPAEGLHDLGDETATVEHA